MPFRTACCFLASAALIVSSAQATVIIYATAPEAVHTGPQIAQLPELPPNIDYFFDVFVKTDVPIVGLSLDVLEQGNRATLTSVVIQNPINAATAGNRWLQTYNAVVSPDGKSAASADAYTLSATNPGLDPAKATTDAGYFAPAGSFHFARVNFRVSSQRGANDAFFLTLGENEIGTAQETDLYFGVAPPGQPPEPPVCQGLDFGCAHVKSLYPEVVFPIPEPASGTLLVLAIFGLVAVVRRLR